MRSLLLTMLCISSWTFGQTTLYTNDFEGASGFDINTTDMGGAPSGADNPWIINDIYLGGSGTFMCQTFSFPFTVPPAPQQPAGITNNPTSTYLHVSPQIAIDGGGNLPCASYIAPDGFCIFGGASTFTRMSSDISTIGYDSVEVDLWWMCGGSTLSFGEAYYSIDGGSSWTPINCPTTGTTQWITQTNWVNDFISDPAWANQSTLRFGFRFVTGTTAAAQELDPGFAVDDIEIIGHIACTPTTSTITETACVSYTAPSGNVYTSSGTYVDTIPNSTGCDSLITINLTVNTVNTNVTQAGPTLTAGAAGAVYQWLDCDNNFAIIPGETNSSYTATTNGNYAVSVTENSCTDTSVCLTVTGIGLVEISANNVRIFPNPANKELIINSTYTVESINVYDQLGQIVITSNSTKLNVAKLETGVYLVKIVTSGGTAVKRFVKK